MLSNLVHVKLVWISFFVFHFNTSKVCVYLYWVSLLLHSSGNLLAYVAFLLMAFVSKFSRASDADARTCDFNLLVVFSNVSQLTFFLFMVN